MRLSLFVTLLFASFTFTHTFAFQLRFDCSNPRGWMMGHPSGWNANQRSYQAQCARSTVTNNFNFHPSSYSEHLTRQNQSGDKATLECQGRVDKRIEAVWVESCKKDLSTEEQRLTFKPEEAKKCLMDQEIKLQKEEGQFPLLAMILPDMCMDIVNGTENPISGFIINLMGYSPEKVKKKIDERKIAFLEKNLKVPLEPVHIQDYACFEFLYTGSQEFAQTCFQVPTENKPLLPNEVATSGAYTCVLEGWKSKYGNAQMSTIDFTSKSLVEDTNNACSKYYRSLSPRPESVVWSGQVERELQRIVENFGAKASEIAADIAIEAFNSCIATAQIPIDFSTVVPAGQVAQQQELSQMISGFNFFGESVGRNQVAEAGYSKVSNYFISEADLAKTDTESKKSNVLKCENRRIEHNNISLLISKPSSIPKNVWEEYIKSQNLNIGLPVTIGNQTDLESLLANQSLTTQARSSFKDNLRDFLVFYFYKSQVKGHIQHIQMIGEVKPNCIPDLAEHRAIVINGPIEEMTNHLFEQGNPSSVNRKETLIKDFYRTVGTFKTDEGVEPKSVFLKDCKDEFSPQVDVAETTTPIVVIDPAEDVAEATTPAVERDPADEVQESEGTTPPVAVETVDAN